MYGAWSDEGHPITLANFILPALQENIVRELVWVVPDENWLGKIGRDDMRRSIRTLCRNGIAGSEIRESSTTLSATVFGRPLTVCSIRHLPNFSEPVLLDVDVDFLVIPNVGYRGLNMYGRLPWLWPVELVSCLTDGRVQTDLVTISYSVEGGYTPLQWKYLGDELAVRLQEGIEHSRTLRGMDAMRVAACTAKKGDFNAAAKGYFDAARSLPNSAAPDLHLAHLNAALGLPELARAHYRKAMSLDASYRTAYNSTGFAYYENKRWKASQAAHERTLMLDTDDPYAHLGLGLLSLRARAWSQAQRYFQRTLQIDEHNIDATRGLAATLVRQSDYLGAVRAYERSLKNALSGHCSLFDGSFARRSLASLTDLGHGQTHIAIAKLYAQMGDIRNAIAGYRMGIAAGTDGVAIRLRLALLLFHRGDKSNGIKEVGHALSRVPPAIRHFHQTLFDRMQRLITDCFWQRFRFEGRSDKNVWI
jgi:tetratricopeptide (TPR) repeat protein